MRNFFTPVRVLTVVGLGLLVLLWCGSMAGLIANTRLGKWFRHGESFTSGPGSRR